MKQNITTLFFSLLLCSGLSAQLTVDNFEGAALGWSGVEGSCFVALNQYKSGINFSDNVLYCEHNVGAANWAGTILSNYRQSGYKYLHAYMYRNNTHVPNLKIFDSDSPVEFAPINTIVAYEWQDVVFDISAYATRGTDFIFFMVDRADNLTAQAWMLIDEVQFSNDPTPRTKVVGINDMTDYKDGYTLVWEDSFDGTKLDTEVWNYDLGTGSQPEYNIWGWGNNELQYYTEEAVTLGKEPNSGNQCLILTATKQYYNGSAATSGRINTLGKVYFTHGIIEASICLPKTERGLWPAFWMMGNDSPTVGWPQCGEIDIMEIGSFDGYNNGVADRYFNGATHYGVAWDNMTHDGNYITADYSVEDGQFHLFTCIWTDESLQFYLDIDKYPTAKPYYTLDLTQYGDLGAGTYLHKPNFLLLNLAVGGDYPYIYDINAVTALTNGPRSMYVDYVRVYQAGNNSDTFEGKQPDYSASAALNYTTQDIKQIQYYDLQGRVVSATTAQHGIYIRRVVLNDNTVITDKIMR